MSRDARRPSLLCVLEQHARRQSTLSLLSADYGLGNPSRRLSASSKALLLQGEMRKSTSAPRLADSREQIHTSATSTHTPSGILRPNLLS